jgi:hypothetical protein
MSMKTKTAMLGFVLSGLVLGVGDAHADRAEFALAGGYSGTTIDIDQEDSSDDLITGNGFGLALRVGLRSRWGLQANQAWVDSNDRVFTGDEISFRALQLHAYRAFRVQREFRPYLKFGLMAFDFEADPGAGSTVSSSGLAPSIGGGFEWGSQRVGVFFDGGWAPTDIELSGDIEESVFIGNSTVGLFYRFGKGKK